ncbi:hypothetical protein J7I98_11720 [Streptomyces sp. ISL-98]|nr:hypothetical protein [Streptomyces sp. ISL-98]
MDERLLALVDSVINMDEERLSLLTRSEARAVVELLQLLASNSGEGAYAARRIAGILARRLPSEG